VKIKGQLIKAFVIGRGLRQCDALCTTLLIIVLEKVIGDIETDRKKQFFKGMRQCIALIFRRGG